MKTSVKHIIASLAVILCMAAFSACTRNGGDIGIWYGTWNFESVTIDGENASGFDTEEYFVQFQRNVVKVLTTQGAHDRYTSTYGTWTEGESTMTWTFSDPTLPPINVPGLETTNNYTIVEKSASKVILQKITPTGTTYRYTLHKVI